jgi:hypothetical protein
MGNRVSDSKAVGLAEAIQSIAEYLAENSLREIVLVGHSYGGMIITGLADAVCHNNISIFSIRLRRNGGMDAWSFHFQSGERHSLMMPISKRRVVRMTP